MKKLILLLTFAFSSIVSIAQTQFYLDGLVYEILSESDKTVEVHDCDNSIGEVSIPETVSYNGKDYSVLSIGDEAFFSCQSLTTITIPGSVRSIGNMAFSYCESLTSIIIPSSVEAIGERAFSSCYGLTMINVDEGNIHYKSIDGVLFDFDVTTLIQCPIGNSRTTYEIPNTVTSIGIAAFFHCESLTSVAIPESVTSIRDYAFYSCLGLTSVSIPSSVVSIGDNAFAWCYGLTSVSIPNSVTFIGGYAFSNCDGLTSVTIPKSVTSIGEMAFSGCDKLTMINVENGNNRYKSIDGVLFNSDATALIQYPIGNDRTSYIIPNSVKFIDAAFGGSHKLTSITIPSSVTSIDEFAFSGSYGLAAINVDSGSYHYKSVDGVLFNFDVTKLVRYPMGKSMTSYVIPNSVTSIGDYAFSGCSGLISVTIPNSVVYIGDSAFSYCEELSSVTIPSSVVSIGEEAFGGCSSIVSVIIPNSVMYIGVSAFSWCSGLTSVTIPNSLISIGDGAFFGCDRLQEVTNFARDPQKIAPIVFEYVDLSNVKLSVPSLSVEKYKNADVWKDFGTIEGMVLPEFRFCSNNYYFETISIQLCGETEFTFPTADILMPYEGFNLEGWTTNADGTGKMFKPNQIVPLDELKGLFMFYAKWVDSAGIDAVETDKIVVSGGVLRNPEGEDIRIYDLNGREMYSGNGSELRLPAGLYILQTSNGSRKVVF